MVAPVGRDNDTTTVSLLSRTLSARTTMLTYFRVWPGAKVRVSVVQLTLKSVPDLAVPRPSRTWTVTGTVEAADRLTGSLTVREPRVALAHRDASDGERRVVVADRDPAAAGAGRGADRLQDLHGERLVGLDEPVAVDLHGDLAAGHAGGEDQGAAGEHEVARTGGRRPVDQGPADRDRSTRASEPG